MKKNTYKVRRTTILTAERLTKKQARTLQQNMELDVDITGWWSVKTVGGGFQLFAPEKFKETFEIVEKEK